MLRGEIRLVDLEPARAGEADKRRPAIIVSNNRANTVAARLGRGVVTVVPVTVIPRGSFRFRCFSPRMRSASARIPRPRPNRSERCQSTASAR